ncbi:MAG: DUF3618 domain-containing protein [Rubrobacteraceae bacterium]
MSEIPERMEREMFEIRSRMAPDVRDLKQHVNPQAVGKKAKNRIKDAAIGFGKGLLNSAKAQVGLAQEAGQKRDPSPLTEGVKRDPRPLIILAVLVTAVLMVARKATNGRDG